MILHDPVADGQSQARASVLGRKEWGTKIFNGISGKPRPIVLDKANQPIGPVPHCYGDLATGTNCLRAIEN